jgi:iron uptake system component EfeO
MLVFVLMPGRSGRPWRVPWRRHGAPAARAAAGGVAAAALACLLLASCSGAEQAADAAGTTTVMVSLTPQGCQPKPASISAGPVTFNVSNDGADAVSEAELLAGQRIMGEKENLAPGLSGTFSLRLNAGAYQVYCPGAERSRWTLRVTGSAAPQAADLRPLLRVAVGQYHDFVLSQASELVRRTDRFVAAVKAGDVGQAKLLFAPARYPYEQIEPVAESFGDLDPRIDARINDVADPASWTGFHRLEKALWVDGSVKGMAPVADQLKADVARLHQLVSTESYQPAQLANGASELLDEVATSKVTGEEDRYSHTDLSDFEANVIGAKEAFEMLRPALDRRDPALGATIEDRFEAVITALAPYLSDTSHDGSGYVSYDTVSTAERRTLAQQVDALAEPLSRVASTIA